jgi:hypothetical protein
MPVQWHVGRPLAVICLLVHSQLDIGRLPWKMLSTSVGRIPIVQNLVYDRLRVLPFLKAF